MSPSPGVDQVDRARGALHGLALGDALGMPTQELPRARARALMSARALIAAPPDQVISAGLAAGTVTDDTEQAVVVAQLLIAGGGSVDPLQLATKLLSWEADMAARGSLDLLGPSTRRALTSIAAGEDPLTTGRTGATNGAAMRITPVGIATAPLPAAALVDAVVAVDLPTHNTGLAHAGAAAVASMVSWGIEGCDIVSAVPHAVQAAQLAQTRGHWVAGPDIAARIEWAVGLVQATAQTAGTEVALDVVDQLVGTSLLTQEAVPAAFAVAVLFANDPWRAVTSAAALGGDSDTIAAMAGAMLGAVHGRSRWPQDALATVRSVNDLDLDPVATELLELRSRPRATEGDAR